MIPPNSQKGLFRFMCVANNYTNTRARFSYTLAILTKSKTSKVQLKWTEVKKEAFKDLTHFPSQYSISLSGFKQTI